jgi:hypothetical protein
VQLGPTKEYGAKLSTVLASGEKIGALWESCQRAKFIDGSHWITQS